MENPEILKEYHTFFSKCFIDNCDIDSDEITETEKNALGELDPDEVFENFSDLVIDLLKFKKQYICTEQADLIKRVNSFEGMIQKLENEVRNHIATEHQLKLLIESYQAKVQELEKMNSELMRRSKEKSPKTEEAKPKTLLRSSSSTKSLEKEDGNAKDKQKGENIVVKSKEFKPTHKRTKSDFEALTSQVNKKSSQTIKSVKFEYVMAKANKLYSQKSRKSGSKMSDIPERKLEKKLKTQKPKHVRSCSDFLAQLRGK
ncbi:hypothetical protein SteCoe_9593 [Stentor coeruleus]|uniref:Uncharacterized protein n=1 Tax=Stentor coeruleus TaxID=5963 RepID=A0A1R2CHE2_9CILI|nr:hypothetical protein SteCoe_9593 [Stentor coeruleus]